MAAAIGLVLALSGLGPVKVGGASVPSPVVTLPDLQINVPVQDISIGTVDGVRQLQYTNISWDAGPGPFEIVPNYNSYTGLATWEQVIFHSTGPGEWSPDHTVPVPVTSAFVPPEHYQFPLTGFSLNAVNPDGTPGAVVASSPKTDFCMIGDTYVGGVPHTPARSFIPGGNCDDPTAPLGWSVGWGDEYDQTDPGQPISLAGVPNGKYILRAIVDPKHVLTESDPTDNEVDTTLSIQGDSVTVLGQSHPSSTIPSIQVTAPTQGADVSGAVVLAATASAAAPASVTSVQFLLDGLPLGPALTGSPYQYQWTPGLTTPGQHFLSALALDSEGRSSVAPPVSITVLPGDSLAIDRRLTVRGTGTVTTTAFSTTTPGDTVVALADSAGPAGQVVSVSGGGLHWTLVTRANARKGDAEIWTARTSGRLAGVGIKATASVLGHPLSLTVVAFEHAAGVGDSAHAASRGSAPQILLAASSAGSMSLATGIDPDAATPRTPAGGDAMIADWADTSAAVTTWSQLGAAESATRGESIELADSEPAADAWNMAAVEIVPATPPTVSDTVAPTVSLLNPLAGEQISGTVPVVADAADNVAVAWVQLYVDGNPLGLPVMAAPFTEQWNTASVINGHHVLTAEAVDTSGNATYSAPVAVDVDNPAEPMICYVMDVEVDVQGQTVVTTPSFHTGQPDEVLVAFVSAAGPGGRRQSVTVSGSGLTWRLVRRANIRTGDAEIWTATAPSVLPTGSVSSVESLSGYAQDLTVIAMQSVAGLGASASASGGDGIPSVSLATSGASSLVFAVGEDPDNAAARTTPSGWVPLSQWVDVGIGATFWSQYTNDPTGPAGSVVSVTAPGTTGDAWNLAAVELVNDGT